MVSLTTPLKVLDSTGVDVTFAHIATAQAVVSLVTGVDLDADEPLPYSKRDLRALTNAVIWQAPYVKDNPDLTSKATNLASASVNGVSVSYRTDTTAAEQLVSPLAAMALQRLSWRGSRTVALRPDRARVSSAQTLTNDGHDSDWRPL